MNAPKQSHRWSHDLSIRVQRVELYRQRRDELEAAGEKSAKVAKEQISGTVSWIRSYVVHEPDGRIGTFCIYEAKDGEAIRDHAKRVGMPGEEFYPIADTVIIRNDPMTAAA